MPFAVFIRLHVVWYVFFLFFYRVHVGGHFLSEHHSFGESEDIAGDYAEELAAEMLATTLGLEFDPDKSWDVKKEVYRLSNEIVRTQNVTQTAVGDKKGLWTTVVAAAVLVG